MMLDRVIEHAIEHIWRDPAQDLQNIIQPARLSPRRGSLGRQQIVWDDVILPDRRHYYHVYQIGQINPKLLGILGLSSQWRSLDKVINDSQIFAQIYFPTGRLLPSFDCYLRWDRHRNIVLAIRERGKFIEIRDEQIELRFYTNTYFKSTYAGGEKCTRIESKIYEGDTEEFGRFRSRYRNFRDNEPGQALAFHNGYFVHDFLNSQLEVDDIIEFIYDSSVKQVIEWDIEDLRVFDSERDQKRKYFLHNHDRDQTDRSVDFASDIDLYLVRKTDKGFNGIYYHRAREDALRMLTHRDYSLPVERLDGIAQKSEELLGAIGDLTLIGYIRDTGNRRELIYEDDRLFELYRLPRDKILDAMVGTNATVEFWQASNLEKSNYNALLHARTNDLNEHVVEKTYGYNGITKVIGDTPIRTEPFAGWPSVDLPVALRYNATAYEYDADGKLIDFHRIDEHFRYPCRSADADAVEVIPSKASRKPSIVYNQKEFEVDPRFNYRVYIATKEGDRFLKDTWRDISNSELIEIEDGKIKVNVDLDHHYLAIVSDETFIGYKFQTAPMNGVITFDITVDEDHGNGYERVSSTIPPRRLDLWINGNYLIEGVDYKLDWPRVVITNFRHYKFDQDQHDIVIRALGFCHEDMSMEKADDYGFIEDGYMGSMRRYEIREDRVQSFVVDGSLVLYDDLEMGEYNHGIKVDGFANGLPFAVKETIIPIRDHFKKDTYKLRDLAREKDQIVTDYLKTHYGGWQEPRTFSIPEYYVIYSPFVARVIMLLHNGFIDSETLLYTYSLEDMKSLLKDHLWLLDFDPAYLGIDEQYISVRAHPYQHAIELDYYQYYFLRNLIDYLYDVEISLRDLITVRSPSSIEES